MLESPENSFTAGERTDRETLFDGQPLAPMSFSWRMNIRILRIMLYRTVELIIRSTIKPLKCHDDLQEISAGSDNEAPVRSFIV